MLKIYTLLIFLFVILEVTAQDFVVRGNVKDQDDSGFPGVVVAEIDRNDRVINGTITDINGNYVIQVTNGESRLQVSFIGFKTDKVDIQKRKIIDFKLLEDVELLQDIDVVAERKNNGIGGISERNRVGAISKMDMLSMNGVPMNDASDALQGQIAGLDIISSGSPGESASIVIRGLSTIGDATPLIVIDGIAQQAYNNFDFSTADVEDLSALLSVPTQDIKEIRVLKDATEAAIWGARGANGVIEIDTYQGRKGKTKFTFAYKNTVDQLPKQMPMLSGNEYIMLQQEELFNNSPFSVIPDEIAYNPKFTDFYNYSQNINWYNEITQSGSAKELTFKIEGGGDNTNYYISVNNSDETGMVINERLKKLNARVNLQFVISKNISLTTRFSYLNSTDEGSWQYSSSLTALKLSYIKAPNMSIYNYDVNGNMSNDYFTPITNYQADGVSYFNPVAVVNLSQNDVSANQLNSDFILQLKLNKYITFSETASLMNKGSKASVFLPQDAIGAKWNDTKNNSAQESNIVNNSLTTRSLLIFSPPKFGNHELQGSLMWETFQTSSSNIYTSTGLNLSNAVTDPAANAIFNAIKSTESESSTLGALARVSYSYKDRYVVSGNVRGDASSRFGRNKRWGIFPSVGVKWRLKDEPFMGNMQFISIADLNLSWGRAGNIPSSVKEYSRQGIYNEGGQYLYDISIIPDQPQLDGLKWETKDEISSAIDLGMFKNKLSILVEYYNKKTTDIAWPNYSIPTSSGYSTLASYNGGEIRNEGFDLTTRMTVIKKKDFSLMLNFNLNRNHNWFEELPPNQDIEKNGGSLLNKTYPYKTQLGSPIGSIFGLRYLGVYSTDADAIVKNEDGANMVDAYGNPVYMVFQNGDRFRGGDAIYEDINHDGVINIYDEVFLGHSNPKLTGGFGGTVRYKDFSLTTNIVFRTGFKVVNQIALETESMNNKDNQSKATLYRWRKDGDNFEGMIPKASYGNQFNSLGSDRYVEDGSFMKLNALTIGYNMNKRLKDKLGITDCSISLSSRKLFTWTKYSGQNPEISTKLQDPFWVAQDDGRTPPSRTFSILFSITL